MAYNDFIVENVLVAFVDTSALDPMFNDYSNMEHQFVALKKHIESHKLILLTHEIAVREMERHIRDEVSKQVDKLIGLQKAKEIALLRTIRKYNPLFSSVDKETVISDTIKSLRAHMKKTGISILILTKEEITANMLFSLFVRITISLSNLQMALFGLRRIPTRVKER